MTVSTTPRGRDGTNLTRENSYPAWASDLHHAERLLLRLADALEADDGA